MSAKHCWEICPHLPFAAPLLKYSKKQTVASWSCLCFSKVVLGVWGSSAHACAFPPGWPWSYHFSSFLIIYHSWLFISYHFVSDDLDRILTHRISLFLVGFRLVSSHIISVPIVSHHFSSHFISYFLSSCHLIQSFLIILHNVLVWFISCHCITPCLIISRFISSHHIPSTASHPIASHRIHITCHHFLHLSSSRFSYPVKSHCPIPQFFVQSLLSAYIWWWLPESDHEPRLTLWQSLACSCTDRTSTFWFCKSRR